LAAALSLVFGACTSSPPASSRTGVAGMGGGGHAGTDAGGATGAAGTTGGAGAGGAGAGGAAGTGQSNDAATSDARTDGTAGTGAAGTGGTNDGGATSTDARDAGSTTADAGDGGAAAPLHVLLIGNSFTIYNDLDVWLQNVASGGTPKILAKRAAVYGMTLQWHWENDAQPAIKGGYATGVPWSHVVLQGYSSEPLNTNGTPAPATSSFQVYAAKLASAAKDVKATPVMFETWAYRACFSEFPSMWGGTPDKMQDGLLAGYTTAAQASGAYLAKIGEGWRAVWTKHPEISLDQIYDADCKHPKVWGTYLAASILYVRLTGHAVPAGSPVPAGMPASVAQTLQAIAQQAGMP
jgi:hypothetical protein